MEKIPMPIISAIANIVAPQYTHTEITNSFMQADIEFYNNGKENKKDRIQNTLNNLNSTYASDKIDKVLIFIKDFLESDTYPKEKKQELREILAKYDISSPSSLNNSASTSQNVSTHDLRTTLEETRKIIDSTTESVKKATEKNIKDSLARNDESVFTKNISHKYKLDTPHNVEDVYNEIIFVAKELFILNGFEESNVSWYLEISSEIGDITCYTKTIEKFIDDTYGINNFKFNNFRITLYGENNTSRKRLSLRIDDETIYISTETKKIISDFEKLFTEKVINKKEESSSGSTTIINNYNNSSVVENNNTFTNSNNNQVGDNNTSTATIKNESSSIINAIIAGLMVIAISGAFKFFTEVYNGNNKVEEISTQTETVEE